MLILFYDYLFTCPKTFGLVHCSNMLFYKSCNIFLGDESSF